MKQLELSLNAPVNVDPKADPASQAKAREELTKRIEKLAAENSGGQEDGRVREAKPSAGIPGQRIELTSPA